MMKRISAIVFFTFISVMALAAQTQEGKGTWSETNSRGLSASHANLPFGTRVRVTNLQNNKQVIVTINNRIAETPDRLIDISKGAAENIEMNPQGATPVRIEIISRRAAPAAEAAPAPPAETPPVAQAPPPAETPPPAQAPPVAETPPPAAQAPAAALPEPPLAAAVPKQPENAGPALTGVPSAGSAAAPAAGVSSLPAGIVNQAIVTINGSPGAPAPVTAPAPVPTPAPVTPPAPVAVPAPVEAPAPTPAPAAVPVPAPVPVEAPAAIPAPVAAPVPVPIPVPVPAARPATPKPASGRRPAADPAPPRTAVVPPPVPAAALPPAAPRIPDPLSRSLYRIQVGSFLGEKNAAAAFNRVQAAGFSPVYERYGDYYRVVLTGLKAAYIEGITRRLGAAGFQDVLVSEER